MPTAGGGGASAVASANITDNTILDEDVNSAAAIALSKINALNQVDNAEIADDVISTITVNLSSAQIKLLATTPVEIIPAPGAGKIIIVDEFVFSLTWVTPSYTAGQSLYLVFRGDNTILINANIPGGVVTAGANAVGRTIAIASKTFTLGIGLAVDITTAPEGVTQFATGNGTAKVFLRYRVLTL